MFKSSESRVEVRQQAMGRHLWMARFRHTQATADTTTLKRPGSTHADSAESGVGPCPSAAAAKGQI